MTDLEVRVQDICLQAQDVIEIKNRVFLINNKIIIEFIGMFGYKTCYCHYVGNDEDIVEVSQNSEFIKNNVEILRKRDKITKESRKKRDIRELLGVEEC